MICYNLPPLFPHDHNNISIKIARIQMLNVTLFVQPQTVEKQNLIIHI